MGLPSLPTPRASRGFTFTEMTVVIVLAGVVTLGLVAFYLHSQVMWSEASTQVLAQRDATAILEMMRDSTQGAASALVLPVPPGNDNHLVIFYDRSLNERNRFFWSAADSFVHYGTPSNPDEGPVVASRVERFHVSTDPVLGLVTVDTLRVRSSIGYSVDLSTIIGLYNQ